MSTPRPRTALALVVATGLAATCVLTGPALAQPVGPAPGAGPEATTTRVAAILLDADGRPTFLDVDAPTVEQAVHRAARVPGVDGVAVDAPMTALATNDLHRASQWNLDALKADLLPAASSASLVAVVDTGVRASHEDFAPGQVRCDLGADFTSENFGACSDRVGHGTHVAGIVAATSGNGRGVASLASGTSILPVRVLDSSGSGGSIAVAKGIVHAADEGAQVINLSLGGPGGSSGLDAAVRYATGKGALVVVSAGNNRQSGNQVNYPAASPGALSVASTDRSGVSSSFSYSGPSVDLAAPGGRIVSLWADGDSAYATASGTSMAAPAVSAIASLYRAAHPSDTPDQVTAALLATATDLETAGRDDRTGAGLVNPSALLPAAAPAPAPAPVAPTTPTDPGAVVPPAPPVLTQPVPVVVSPAPKPPVTKAPAPRARVATPRVAPGQAIPLQLADFRPASSVTVLEVFPITTRVRVTVNGRKVLRLQTTNRTVVLGTFIVAADGTVAAKVLPVQGVKAGTLVVRGLDRVGKVVRTTTPIRVG